MYPFLLSHYYPGALLTYYYPHIMAVVFLAFLTAARIPAKGFFFLRALVALAIASLLAHLNRMFYFWPEHPFFASGHMTFCLGVAISLGMLRVWTLAITLPLLVPMGMALMAYHFHDMFDILGAIPIVLVIYLPLHLWWRLPGVSRISPSSTTDHNAA